MSQAEIYQHLVSLVGETRKRLTERNLGAFFTIYLEALRTTATPPFHLEMMKDMERFTEGGGGPRDVRAHDVKDATNFTAEKQNGIDIKRRLLFVAPRGFAKSTLCSVAFPLWLALFRKKTDIMLVSATASLAKEMLRKVRNELKNNPKVLQDFGDLVSDEKDTEEHVILKNGVQIRAKGRGFQIRGLRPDCIVCDDLEDEEIIYSKEQREKLEHWFMRTLLPTLKPDQGLLYVGTMLHQASLMAKLRIKPEFTSRFYQALTNGRSIWEEMWPTERLNELRRELGEYAFLAEYQNNPISLSEQPIKPHFLDGVKIKGEPVALCLAIDPAISEKESADERGFSLFAKISDGKDLMGFREIYSEAGRWGIEEQLDRIIGIWERYSKAFPGIPFRIVVESVAFQKVYKPILLKRAKDRDIWLPVSEAELGMGGTKRPKDKFTRLMQVVHLFEQRLVEVQNPQLYGELIAFPLGDSDNLVDATVFALYWLMTFRAGGYMAKREEKRIPIKAKPSYYVHEVRPGVFIAKDEPPLMKRMKLLRIK